MENRIKMLRRQRDWSQEKLARRVGTSNQMISLLERGRRRMTLEWLERLAQALECRPADIFKPSNGPVILGNQPRDLPIRGTAAGSASGAFQLRDNDCIGFVRRPKTFSHNSNVYAIYVVGDSMAPAHQDGELRFVDPDSEPAAGDFVIALIEHYPGAGVQAYIKRLKSRSVDWLLVEQFNPIGELKLATATIRGLHRILTMNDLFEG
jgi:transcriptional regulator with XRE-family HTH domain